MDGCDRGDDGESEAVAVLGAGALGLQSSRWLRLVSEICWAAAVIVRRGRSTRPATTQPSRPEKIAMIPSAIPDSISSWCSSVTCCWVSASRKNS
jgi:hypothetical protein